MKNVKRKIFSDLKKDCMRDFQEWLGVDWLPTVSIQEFLDLL